MEDHYAIQHLLETKSFDELTAAERNEVLQHLTENEYTLRRNMLQSMRAFLQDKVAEAKPNPQIIQNIAARMQAPKPVPVRGGLWQAFAFKIPVYVPAVAVIVLLFLLPVLYQRHTGPVVVAVSSMPGQKIMYKTDTVRVETPVTKYVNVPVVKYVDRIKEVPVSNDLAVADTFDMRDTEYPLNPYGMTFTREQAESQVKNVGLPSSDNEALNKFLVVTP